LGAAQWIGVIPAETFTCWVIWQPAKTGTLVIYAAGLGMSKTSKYLKSTIFQDVASDFSDERTGAIFWAKRVGQTYRLGQYIPPKNQLTYTGLHGII
jgi:hypothetical protein